MISGKQEFFDLIEEGRQGNNIGLTIGSKKLELYMDGLLPGTSYLIGAQSGIGKSTYALYSFIYCPLKQYLSGENVERDPYWILFNLEMTRSQIYAKLVSMYIFDTFGEQIRFKEMFSRGKDCILSDEHLELIKQCDSFIDELDKRIKCIDGSLNEEKFVKNLQVELLRFGHWKSGIFVPNNPKQVVVSMIDHMSLIKGSQGRSKKEEMDAVSRAGVILRNTTKILSPIEIAQFNRGSGSDERLKQDMLEPTEMDFKDTGSLYENAQVVIALYSPVKQKRRTWNKYNVENLDQILIGTYLLKSRFGTSNICVATAFYGDCSHYYELPAANQIYDYTKYTNPNWVLYKEDNVKTEEDKQSVNNFKFTL